jgi:hypothetical protein
MPKEKKMKIEVDNYNISKEFDIDTFGISGSICLKRKSQPANK